MKVYGALSSGNCLKVKYVADYLELDYDWIPVDVLGGEARKPEVLAKNPVGQVPFIETADGKVLSQSNAIMRFLAEGSSLIPTDAFTSAQMDQWMFWEQYSHETAIAVARFRVLYQGYAVSDLDPELVTKGNAALDIMEMHLMNNQWFVGDRLTLSDIALLAYTQFAEQPGFSLNSRPSITRWLVATKSELGIE